MTTIKWAILVLAAAILQRSALLEVDVFGLSGVKPDLFLILVVVFSLYHGKRKGEVFGFLAGLLQDSLSSGYLGVNALAKTVVGYLGGSWRKQFFWRNLPAQVLLIFVFSIISDTIYALLNASAVLAQPGGLKDAAGLIMASGAFSSIVSPLVFYAALKFDGSDEKTCWTEKKI